MTINAETARELPLRSERDMVLRIRDLLAPASSTWQLWSMFLDARGHQIPLMIPIGGPPPAPHPRILDALAAGLAAAIDEHCGGDGSVLFVVERSGPLGTTPEDRDWAAALRAACGRAGVRVTGTFLLSRGGVQTLPV